MELNSEDFSIPQGFRFAGISCGIKASEKLDLSVLVADQDCVTLGMFTQNLVRASSVDWNEGRVGNGRSLVINSGNANACTGEQGVEDTATMAQTLADQLACPADQVYVMSTGIIGELMPMEKVVGGIKTAAQQCETDESSVRNFAQGILTTDSFPKICSRQFTTESGTYSILGIAKGAGMIGPKMATMLCVLVTDFPLSPEATQHAGNQSNFRSTIDRTFNCISVDGHTSTSDQVLLFAPAASDGLGADVFFEQLDELCEELAKMIPADGEGAKHLINIEVKGDFAEQELRSVAKTIADSPLVKTAVFGADPNWGRIVSAAGYNGLQFSVEETSLWVNGYLLFQNGSPIKFDAAEVSASIKDNFETDIVLEISRPPSNASLNSAKYWTCDLTYDYVKINAEYHT